MKGYREGHRNCAAGTENWVNQCKQIEWGLVNKCSAYVTPSNTPTAEGVRAKNCITNGAIITAAGFLLTKDPGTIIAALRPLSDMTGCGGIVDWNTLETSAAAKVSDFLRVLGID
jgi:hypothetical protein